MTALPLDGLPADRPQHIDCFVHGLPAPQGSKRAILHKQSGKAITIESSTRVKPWRADVRAALVDDDDQPRAHITGAVHARLDFVLPRPKYLARKATPPHTKAPDIDKLQRSTLDAITSSQVWSDDAAVVDIHATKRYAEPDEPSGCHITIHPAELVTAEEPMRA